MVQRLFLRKTDKAKMEANPKLPYFTLVVPPEGDEDANGDWEEVGALWKAKSGNGYSGKVKDGVVIRFAEVKKPDPRRREDEVRDRDRDLDRAIESRNQDDD